MPDPALLLALATALLALAVPVYFAHRKPGYSHSRHTISELGEVGSPVARTVAWLGFLPIGLLCWATLAALAAEPSNASYSEVFLMFSLVGTGYVGAAFFPCDAGAPATGSTSNLLHNLCGVAEYLGAAAAFAWFSRELVPPASALFQGASVMILLLLWALSLKSPLRGALQRLAETLIFGGLIGMAALV